MILITTQSIGERQVSQYLRIVSAEAVSGVNLFKDFGASFHNLVGGRSGAYERGLGIVRETTLAELYQRTEAMGANAVVGVDISYEVLGADNRMLMVTTSDTTVTPV